MGTALQKQSARDLRVDFLRGLALLVIFLDHQEDLVGFAWAHHYTLISLTYCDALEVFIFISGYVCGITYGKTLGTWGYRACQSKALRRCARLYVANAVLFLLVLVIAVASDQGDRVVHSLEGARLSYAVGDPIRGLCSFLLGQYHPLAMDILHLYIMFLLVTPAFLWLASRNVMLACAVSYAVYGLAQVLPLLDYHTYPDGLNPFAWQLLFCIGLLIGKLRPAWLGRLVANRYFLVGAALALLAGVAVRLCVPNLLRATIEQDGFWMQMATTFPATSRPTLHPFRLLTFLFLATVVLRICPTSPVLERSWLARSLMRCGQHSLTIFCAGVVLDYLGALILVPACQGMPLSWTVPLLDIGGIVLLLTLARILSLRNMRLSLKVGSSGSG